MNDNAPSVRFAYPHDLERAEPYCITPEAYDLCREEIAADLFRRVSADLFRAEPDLDNISCARIDDLKYQALCIVEEIIAETPPWELPNLLRAQPDDHFTNKPPYHEPNEVNL